MTIKAEIVLDSIDSCGIRLTTFILKYPRFIHSEYMTHRAFSRNASSSRATPIEKQIEMILQDPVIPIDFRKNQKGMQAGDTLDPANQYSAREAWNAAMQYSITKAQTLSNLGVHKQHANRLLEPFSHITVICTATEYANFFALRNHSAAQPEIAELAKKMWVLYSSGTPQRLQKGDWHLPFVSEDECMGPDSIEDLIKFSVARCARVSYLNHDGSNPDPRKDLELYTRLLGKQPIHASPAEHQAMCTDSGKDVWSGNFRGWLQYRKTLIGENIETFKEPLG